MKIKYILLSIIFCTICACKNEKVYNTKSYADVCVEFMSSLGVQSNCKCSGIGLCTSIKDGSFVSLNCSMNGNCEVLRVHNQMVVEVDND